MSLKRQTTSKFRLVLALSQTNPGGNRECSVVASEGIVMVTIPVFKKLSVLLPNK